MAKNFSRGVLLKHAKNGQLLCVKRVRIDEQNQETLDQDCTNRMVHVIETDGCRHTDRANISEEVFRLRQAKAYTLDDDIIQMNEFPARVFWYFQIVAKKGNFDLQLVSKDSMNRKRLRFKTHATVRISTVLKSGGLYEPIVAHHGQKVSSLIPRLEIGLAEIQANPTQFSVGRPSEKDTYYQKTIAWLTALLAVAKKYPSSFVEIS